MDGVGAGGGREGPPPKSTNLDSQADTFIIEAADLGVIYMKWPECRGISEEAAMAPHAYLG